MAIPAIPILIGAALFFMSKKGAAAQTGGGSATGSGSGGAVATGSPKLEVKKSDINPLFNSVEFTVFWPDGSKNKYLQKRKNGPIQKIIGEYTLNTKFGERTVKVLSSGETKVDPMGALDIVISNKQGQPLTAKRVILEDKNVIDLI